MTLTKRETEGSIEYFLFDTDAWVAVHKEEGLWECQDGEDIDSYQSGGFVVDNGTVVDYDGCYGLPESVISALSLLYKMDI